MDYDKVSEMIRGNIRDCARRGRRPPQRPNAEDLWLMLDGDGPMALLVTLDYLCARSEYLDELDRVPVLA